MPRAAAVLARLSWVAMRRRVSAAIALVGLVATCLSSSLVAVTPTSAAPTFTSPVTVAVQGNQIVNGAGTPVRLIGVNRSDSGWSCAADGRPFIGPRNVGTVTAMQSWGANTVRIGLNEDCWLGLSQSAISAASYQHAIIRYVEELETVHMAVILTLQFSAPGNFQAINTNKMPDADHSRAFWRSVATTFLGNTGVMFDAFSEAHKVSWRCWTRGCYTRNQEGQWRAVGIPKLVSIIRSTGNNQPIILSGLHFGNDLSHFPKKLPADPQHQLIVGFHMYPNNQCNSKPCWSQVLKPLAAAYPVVADEVGEYDCTANFVLPFFTWADTHGISYLPWGWYPGGCRKYPAMIKNFGGHAMTNYGAPVHHHMVGLGLSRAFDTSGG